MRSARVSLERRYHLNARRLKCRQLWAEFLKQDFTVEAIEGGVVRLSAGTWASDRDTFSGKAGAIRHGHQVSVHCEDPAVGTARAELKRVGGDREPLTAPDPEDPIPSSRRSTGPPHPGPRVRPERTDRASAQTSNGPRPGRRPPMLRPPPGQLPCPRARYGR